MCQSQDYLTGNIEFHFTSRLYVFRYGWQCYWELRFARLFFSLVTYRCIVRIVRCYFSWKKISFVRIYQMELEVHSFEMFNDGVCIYPVECSFSFHFRNVEWMELERNASMDMKSSVNGTETKFRKKSQWNKNMSQKTVSIVAFYPLGIQCPIYYDPLTNDKLVRLWIYPQAYQLNIYLSQVDSRFLFRIF